MPGKSVRPIVGVFDADLPTGIAFVRSLGRAGAHVTALHEKPRPAGRYSRHSRRFRRAPSLFGADRFAPWLEEMLRTQQLDLVAPTSDYVAWYIARCQESFAPGVQRRMPPPQGVLQALFKDRFSKSMESTGLPAPATCVPITLDDARHAARALGYPVVLKPRSHIGVGLARGLVVRDEAEMQAAFRPFEMMAENGCVEAEHPHVALPLVQRYIDPASSSLVSVSGFITPEGRLAAVTYAVKRSQWPPRLGIGTVFETIEPPAFANAAIDAVRAVLGHGIFELEVMHNAQRGEAYSLDLNPRGFGQMSLDIACGAELPQLWYRSMLGHSLDHEHVSRPGVRWVQSVPYYIHALARFAKGPGRSSVGAEYARELLQRRVDVAHSWSDPLPGLLFGLKTLRHPRGILRSYLKDTEVVENASK